MSSRKHEYGSSRHPSPGGRSHVGWAPDDASQCESVIDGVLIPESQLEEMYRKYPPCTITPEDKKRAMLKARAEHNSRLKEATREQDRIARQELEARRRREMYYLEQKSKKRYAKYLRWKEGGKSSSYMDSSAGGSKESAYVSKRNQESGRSQDSGNFSVVQPSAQAQARNYDGEHDAAAKQQIMHDNDYVSSSNDSNNLSSGIADSSEFSTKRSIPQCAVRMTNKNVHPPDRVYPLFHPDFLPQRSHGMSESHISSQYQVTSSNNSSEPEEMIVRKSLQQSSSDQQGEKSSSDQQGEKSSSYQQGEKSSSYQQGEKSSSEKEYDSKSHSTKKKKSKSSSGNVSSSYHKTHNTGSSSEYQNGSHRSYSLQQVSSVPPGSGTTPNSSPSSHQVYKSKNSYKSIHSSNRHEREHSSQQNQSTHELPPEYVSQKDRSSRRQQSQSSRKKQSQSAFPNTYESSPLIAPVLFAASPNSEQLSHPEAIAQPTRGSMNQSSSPPGVKKSVATAASRKLSSRSNGTVEPNNRGASHMSHPLSQKLSSHSSSSPSTYSSSSPSTKSSSSPTKKSSSSPATKSSSSPTKKSSSSPATKSLSSPTKKSSSSPATKSSSSPASKSYSYDSTYESGGTSSYESGGTSSSSPSHKQPVSGAQHSMELPKLNVTDGFGNVQNRGSTGSMLNVARQQQLADKTSSEQLNSNQFNKDLKQQISMKSDNSQRPGPQPFLALQNKPEKSFKQMDTDGSISFFSHTYNFDDVL